jgi:hypothetical protein
MKGKFMMLRNKKLPWHSDEVIVESSIIIVKNLKKYQKDVILLSVWQHTIKRREDFFFIII